MLKVFKSVIESCVPQHLKDSPYQYRKARSLVYVLLFSLIIGLVSWGLSVFIFTENAPEFLPGIFILSSILFAFRKWGNFNFAGNMLAFNWAIILFPTIHESGGIYSDNLLWMVIAPLIAFLYANYQSGLFWSVLIISSLGITYFDASKINFENSYLVYEHDYYFFSYLFLFFAILGIAFIFKRGKEDMIREIAQQKTQLSIQKEELSKQAEELQAAKTSLLQSNKELENFAYVASHDLKEPLRMISAYSVLLEKYLSKRGIKDAASGEYLDYVIDGSKRMEKLMEDLLAFSRLDKGTQVAQPVDLGETLVTVIENLMVRMQESKTVITATHLPVVKGNSTSLIQLFQNLISNAIKFQHPEETPCINIVASKHTDGFVCISITDNGIGIPKDRQSAVFAIFERAHSKHQFEGSGIGLATCKKIVENMGGKIWLTSTEGEGTTFYITLPAEQVESERLIPVS